jgi:TonB family protein
LPPQHEHLEENNDIETGPLGNILISYYSWPGNVKGSGVCGVVVYRLSDDLARLKKPEEILDSVIRAQANAQLAQHRRSFTFQDSPAASYRTSFSDEKGIAYARELFVYASGSVYRVNFVASRQDELDAPEVETFFESFHIDRLTAEEERKRRELGLAEAAHKTRSELDEMAKKLDEMRGHESASNEVVSAGNLNSKAVELPPPVYPPLARTAKASGDVEVQVTVNEKGEVISATAVSGDSLLRAPATAAARQARFNPETRNGKPVKVKGTLVFSFH